MKDFISEIKKINTDGLIYKFSEISIEMFKKVQCWRNVGVPVVRCGKRQKMLVQLSAWDIPNIAFLSVKNSNDYRHADRGASIGQLVNLYREYENEHSAAENIELSEREIFEKDYLCFVMTIRELEILLYRNDKVKEEQILNRLLDSTKPDGLRKNIGAIYEELSINENQHFDGQMDYFSKMMEHLGRENG